MNHSVLCLTPLLAVGSQMIASKTDFDPYIFPTLQVHKANRVSDIHNCAYYS